MSNTHTPGPWRITTDFIGIYDSEGRCIADMDSESAPEFGESETLANARLIAEAPAMLEALRAIATYMRGDLTADDFKAFGLKRGDMTGNVRRIAENVLTRIDGEAAQ